MNVNYKLAAYPLLSIDPFISIWSYTEKPYIMETRTWFGQNKRLTLEATVDGTLYSLMGRRKDIPHGETEEIYVTPTCTRYDFSCGGVMVSIAFRAPHLMDDLDLLSTPVNFVDISAVSQDGKTHEVSVRFIWHDEICRCGEQPVPMLGKDYQANELHIAWMGKTQQNMLCHSGDHVSIDWGYAYMAADAGVRFERLGGHWGLKFERTWQTGDQPQTAQLLLGYDQVADIQYFDYTAKAYYARNGKTIVQALHEMHAARENIYQRLDALDKQLLTDALRVGGESYAALVVASYRQSICAHKLIADKDGSAVFLSKENDSNGCIGTADVSYPSMPLYLIYAPELVRGLCRGILKFANMPVWKYDYAPHDVGRYPHATGQVYGLAADAYGMGTCDKVHQAECYPPLYLDEGEENIYDHRMQMPVEECGNMILMLAAAAKADGDMTLVREYLPTLQKWVKYLTEYGEDPGDQLCTDDFAGHLAHNVNLAFKAVYGLAGYAYLMEKLGDQVEADKYYAESRRMALAVYEKAKTKDGTALTLDGKGWSLKYNAVWDVLFDLNYLPEEFFCKERETYLEKTNTYGVPLDSRADYTKSDWILWCAAMSDEAGTVEAYSAPIAKYMAETSTRVPFGDWYDTKTGRIEHFMGRSVQGGIFMPLLKEKWLKK